MTKLLNSLIGKCNRFSLSSAVLNWWLFFQSGRGVSLSNNYLQALNINVSSNQIYYIFKHNIPRQKCVDSVRRVLVELAKVSPTQSQVCYGFHYEKQ